MTEGTIGSEGGGELRRWWGAAQMLVGVLLVGGVWAALPARWWPVDVVATSLGGTLLAAGFGLFRDDRWGWRLTRMIAWVTLAIGAATVTGIVWTVAYLRGVYGPVGAGGAILLSTVALLLLPYLVVFPAAQLWWLRRAPAS